MRGGAAQLHDNIFQSIDYFLLKIFLQQQERINKHYLEIIRAIRHLKNFSFIIESQTAL